ADLPEGWWNWPNVLEAHKLLSRACLRDVPVYPHGRYDGRGVVICAGGKRMFTNAWVCLRMLRHLGCDLAVEFWHLPDEIDSYMAGLIGAYGAACVDARETGDRLGAEPRILGGWELKAFAMLHTRFREVLLLDADNVPVVNPDFLFETPQFRSCSAIFWPDFGRMAPSRPMWSAAEVPYRDEPEIESGQIVLDKARCWTALNLAMHYNNHSDYYYHLIHGDKCTFQFAWHRPDTAYAMPEHGIHALEATMCQHDFDGRRIFQHRNTDKWRLDGSNHRVRDFWLEADCRHFLVELASKWNGQPYSTSDISVPARRLRCEIAGRRFVYHRVGFDRREMVLLESGKIGSGTADCERRWCVDMRGGTPQVVISGEDGVICRLVRACDGTLKGRWLRHERMPVEMIPIVETQADVRLFDFRNPDNRAQSLVHRVDAG
ncbi:MAG: hypothetical protein ACREHD_34330, partial [Pirellulales bacterium]